MGGAPPPPLGDAPQGSKMGKNWPFLAYFDPFFDPEDHAQTGGVRGVRPLPPPPYKGELREPLYGGAVSKGGSPGGSNRHVARKAQEHVDLAPLEGPPKVGLGGSIWGHLRPWA